MASLPLIDVISHLEFPDGKRTLRCAQGFVPGRALETAGPRRRITDFMRDLRRLSGRR
jgi:hypothetical protein